MRDQRIHPSATCICVASALKNQRWQIIFEHHLQVAFQALSSSGFRAAADMRDMAMTQGDQEPEQLLDPSSVIDTYR
ncbi:hypothetical protein ABDX87_27860 [Pseudomonas abietaniphila]